MTTDTQISAVKAMCEAMVKAGVVANAYVNDWGRFGNFDVFVYPLVHDRHTTRRLQAIVKKFMPKGAHLREMFGPDPIREWNPWTRKSKLIGYTRKFWSVDIDYQHYDAGTNSFA